MKLYVASLFGVSNSSLRKVLKVLDVKQMGADLLKTVLMRGYTL